MPRTLIESRGFLSLHAVILQSEIRCRKKRENVPVHRRLRPPHLKDGLAEVAVEVSDHVEVQQVVENRFQKVLKKKRISWTLPDNE